MTTVIDKGPPSGSPDHEVEAWKKESPDGKPIQREMPAVDAIHACASDPKRYELVHHDFVIVYDLGPGVAMERKAAEALVATDSHRYTIKDPNPVAGAQKKEALHQPSGLQKK